MNDQPKYWYVRKRTGETLPGQFSCLTDAYASVVEPGNGIYKYLFVLE